MEYRGGAEGLLPTWGSGHGCQVACWRFAQSKFWQNLKFNIQTMWIQNEVKYWCKPEMSWLGCYVNMESRWKLMKFGLIEFIWFDEVITLERPLLVKWDLDNLHWLVFFSHIYIYTDWVGNIWVLEQFKNSIFFINIMGNIWVLEQFKNGIFFINIIRGCGQ